MIARQEAVKVLYNERDEPIAVILNGSKPPIVYRMGQLDSDELANLFESGDPDQETDILRKAAKKV